MRQQYGYSTRFVDDAYCDTSALRLLSWVALVGCVVSALNFDSVHWGLGACQTELQDTIHAPKLEVNNNENRNEMQL